MKRGFSFDTISSTDESYDITHTLSNETNVVVLCNLRLRLFRKLIVNPLNNPDSEEFLGFIFHSYFVDFFNTPLNSKSHLKESQVHFNGQSLGDD